LDSRALVLGPAARRGRAMSLRCPHVRWWGLWRWAVDLRDLLGSASAVEVEGAPTEEPRPDTSNARSQRPATRAAGVSRALVCVLQLNAERPWPVVALRSQLLGVACTGATATAPVIHPVAKKRQRVGAFFSPMRGGGICGGVLLGCGCGDVLQVRFVGVGVKIRTCRR
jgi:hypothetical protein